MSVHVEQFQMYGRDCAAIEVTDVAGDRVFRAIVSVGTDEIGLVVNGRRVEIPPRTEGTP